MAAPLDPQSFERTLERLRRITGPGTIPEIDDYLAARPSAPQDPELVGAPTQTPPASSESYPTFDNKIDNSNPEFDNSVISQAKPPSKPKSIASDNLSPQKKCRELKPDGSPCRAWRLRGGDLCYFHDTTIELKRLQASSKGGSHSSRTPAHLPILDLETLSLQLVDRLSLQVVLEGVARMQLVGALPTRFAAQVLRNLRMIERNLPYTCVPEEIDREDYKARVEAFITAATTIAEAADDRDVYERSRIIEDAGLKRAHVLKAVERHTNAMTPAHRRPTSFR